MVLRITLRLLAASVAFVTGASQAQAYLTPGDAFGIPAQGSVIDVNQPIPTLLPEDSTDTAPDVNQPIPTLFPESTDTTPNANYPTPTLLPDPTDTNPGADTPLPSLIPQPGSAASVIANPNPSVDPLGAPYGGSRRGSIPTAQSSETTTPISPTLSTQDPIIISTPPTVSPEVLHNAASGGPLPPVGMASTGVVIASLVLTLGVYFRMNLVRNICPVRQDS